MSHDYLFVFACCVIACCVSVLITICLCRMVYGYLQKDFDSLFNIMKTISDIQDYQQENIEKLEKDIVNVSHGMPLPFNNFPNVVINEKKKESSEK